MRRFSIVVYLWLLVVIPLVINRGYEDIAVIKVKSFAIALLLVLIVSGIMIVSGRKTKHEKMAVFEIGLDVGVLGFGLAAIVSTLLSEWRWESLWATDASFVGMFLVAGLSVIYLFQARYATFSKIVWYGLYVAGLAVMSLGLYHRLFLTHYDGYTYWFSTIGNVDFYYGYIAIVMTVFMAIRGCLDVRIKRFAIDLLLVVGYLNAWFSYALVIYVALALGFIFVLFSSLASSKKMKSIAVQGMLASVTGLIAKLIFIIEPSKLIGMEEWPLYLLYYRAYYIIGIISIGGYYLVSYAEKQGWWKVWQINVRKYKWVFPIVVGIAILLSFLIVMICSTAPVVINRIDIWSRVIRTYESGEAIQFIFGYGLGCLNEAMTSVAITNTLGQLSIQTAHNELLEWLISMGIVGVCFYLWIIGYVIRDFLKSSSNSGYPNDCIYAACGIGAYLAQSISNPPTPVNVILFVGLLSVYRVSRWEKRN